MVKQCYYKDGLELIILDMLRETPMHGYAIMKKLEELAGYKPSPGLIYPVLKSLLEKGFVEVRIKKRGERIMKEYAITSEGVEYLERKNDKLVEFKNTINALREFRDLVPVEITDFMDELVQKLPSLSREDKERLREVFREFVAKAKEILEGGGNA